MTSTAASARHVKVTSRTTGQTVTFGPFEWIFNPRGITAATVEQIEELSAKGEGPVRVIQWPAGVVVFENAAWRDPARTEGSGMAGQDPVTNPFGQHFTAAELGQIWKLDESTVRRIFQDEPGVLKIGKSNRRDGKRDYVTLRIPEAVARRVYEERSRW